MSKLPPLYFAVSPRIAEPQLVVGAPGDRVVALPRIEGPSTTRSRSTSSGMMKFVSA